MSQYKKLGVIAYAYPCPEPPSEDIIREKMFNIMKPQIMRAIEIETFEEPNGLIRYGGILRIKKGG